METATKEALERLNFDERVEVLKWCLDSFETVEVTARHQESEYITSENVTVENGVVLIETTICTG